MDARVSGSGTSLALTGDGDPVISCTDSNPRAVVLARLIEGAWVIQTLDGVDRANLAYTGLALDHLGNPAVAYCEIDTSTSSHGQCPGSSLPNGERLWPVGSVQDIEWYGGGSVDVYLSVDGGNSYDLLESGYSSGQGGGVLSLRVPHRPSRFAMIRVERPSHFSVAESDSFLTIEASISDADAGRVSRSGGGRSASWETNPGPADLGGYKIERSAGGTVWDVVTPLTRETSYLDLTGAPGMRYRLTAITAWVRSSCWARPPLPLGRPSRPGPFPTEGESSRYSLPLWGRGGGLGRPRSHLRRERPLVRAVAEATMPRVCSASPGMGEMQTAGRFRTASTSSGPRPGERLPRCAWWW